MGGVNAQYLREQNSVPTLDPTSFGSYAIRPVAPIEVMSSQPEAVAQGIGQGLQGLAGGAIGAWKAYAKNHPPAPQTPSVPYQYSSPQQATPFAQIAAQTPEFYSGMPSFSSVANVGTGSNFIANPFFQY